MKQTRKQQAAVLLERLAIGPGSFDPFSPMSEIRDKEDRAAAKAAYHLWCETWVIPLVKRLVPELSRKSKGRK
jgi:hypothetical protein